MRNGYTTVLVSLEVLAAALGAVADGENYLPVPCADGLLASWVLSSIVKGC